MTPPTPHPPDGQPTVGAAAAAKARFWDRAARKYAAARIADMAGYEATLQRVVSLLSPDDVVLELGCGTGTTALRLAAHTRSLLATDVSAQMITIAREKLAALPQALPQLRFEQADADVPPATDTRFDTVLAFNLLHLLTDLDGALEAIKAALKPGGLFISKTACLAEMNPLVPRLLVPLMQAVGKAPRVLVFDGGGLQAALQRHGFVIEAAERHGSTRKDIRIFIVARRPA